MKRLLFWILGNWWNFPWISWKMRRIFRKVFVASTSYLNPRLTCFHGWNRLYLLSCFHSTTNEIRHERLVPILAMTSPRGQFKSRESGARENLAQLILAAQWGGITGLKLMLTQFGIPNRSRTEPPCSHHLSSVAAVFSNFTRNVAVFLNSCHSHAYNIFNACWHECEGLRLVLTSSTGLIVVLNFSNKNEAFPKTKVWQRNRCYLKILGTMIASEVAVIPSCVENHGIFGS